MSKLLISSIGSVLAPLAMTAACAATPALARALSARPRSAYGVPQPREGWFARVRSAVTSISTAGFAPADLSWGDAAPAERPGLRQGLAELPVRRVLIVQCVAKHYRRRLFDLMYQQLSAHGVELTVAYADPNPVEALRGDNANLPASYGVKLPARWMAGQRLIYQPIGRLALQSDLVIVEQANKYVMNYPLLLLARLGLKRVAYWGHGRNRKLQATTLRERLKRAMAGWAQWWFPYTEGCAAELAAAGVASERMTALQNSVDTRAFERDLAALSADEITGYRTGLGLQPTDRVALFCGSLYASKALGLLLDAGARIAAANPDFRLLIVGNGPDRAVVEAAAREHAWLRYVGPQFGRGKALAFAASEVVLNPGAVGLAILDSFAAGRPFVAAAHAHHGPEADYLRHGHNGLMLAPDAQAIADGVAGLLADGKMLERMRAAARSDCAELSIEAMAQRFSAGILASLASDRRCVRS